MAIAQRQYARAYTHSAARPIELRRPRPAAGSRERQQVLPLRSALIALGIVCAAVFYLWGYVLMTAANYETVTLKREYSSLQAENHMLRSQLIERRNKDAVDQWAAANGMQRASSAQFILTSHDRTNGR